MAETINLIPQEERIEQTQTKVVKVSTWITLALLIIVGGVSGYFFYKAQTLKNELKGLKNDVTNLRAEITQLSDIEIDARNLFKKSNTLRSIFEGRIYYSIMLDELEKGTPGSIAVESFSLSKDNSISLSGLADDYNSVQEFSNQLLESDVFTEVQLNSVGLEKRENKVDFFIVVKYNEEFLYE